MKFMKVKNSMTCQMQMTSWRKIIREMQFIFGELQNSIMLKNKQHSGKELVGKSFKKLTQMPRQDERHPED